MSASIEQPVSDIVFIGAGRLATQLALALHATGSHRITAVYSRTMTSAKTLADMVGAVATNDIASLPQQADAMILAVKDDALPTLAGQIAAGHKDIPAFHTAGSVPATVLRGFDHYGVIYPMQTFSKERHVDFARIPFFIEGNDNAALSVARAIASAVSKHVTVMDSDRRRQLHLAAVFACNFANHCYTLASDILERADMPFDILLPLIEETVAKVADMHPKEAQTGPAVRYDKSVIERQSQMLADNPLTQQIYELMSQSIHNHCVE